MEKTGNNISQKNHLLISAIIALAVGFAVYLLVRFTADKPVTPIHPFSEFSSDTLTPPSINNYNPTTTLTPNPITTPSITLSPTPSPFPTPFKGTIGPPGFNVGPWHDDYIPCDSRNPKVLIYGVEAFGGIPPYQFTFWQINETRTVSSKTNNIEFDNPVRVNKGTYVHVTITYPSANGKATWVDDLYYQLKNSECTNTPP